MIPTKTTTKKTESSSSAFAERYRIAHRKVLESLPNWKKEVVIDCMRMPASEVNDRVYDEFVGQVIKLAEQGELKGS